MCPVNAFERDSGEPNTIIENQTSRKKLDITLSKVWSLDDLKEGIYFEDYLSQKYGKARKMSISISDTPFQMFIGCSQIAPMIFDTDKWEAWEIKGIGEDFIKTKNLSYRSNRLIFSRVEGDADINRVWTLTFLSDSIHDLIVEYEEIWDGW